MTPHASLRPFRLLLVSAMYENGGNTTHRLLDGHPEMLVYPFESQLGSKLVQDHLSSLFPLKYRWPVFDLAATPEQDFAAIIDEECRVRLRTPHVSKFRHVPMALSDDERRQRYVEHVAASGRSRPANVAAFFRATFDAWHDCAGNRDAEIHVGYSPVVVVDAQTILAELPDAHVLHVVRNPWSAYADTKKRPVPMSLASYVFAWVVNQHAALVAQTRFPDRLHIVRFEDIVDGPRAALGAVCEKVGASAAPTLDTPSWNGAALDQVYPWGTIRRPTAEANLATARELSEDERAQVAAAAGLHLDHFGYRGMI
ncbi:MAG: sulfotransferase [Vicinamibacterales bacterium]